MEPTERVVPMDSSEVIAKAMETIEKGTPLLTDKAQEEYFIKTLQSLKDAEELVDNDEKTARMKDASVKFANQLCFILFREGTITQDLTDLLRSLPTPEMTSEEVKAYTDARDARIKALNDAHSLIVDEQKNLDVFLAVIAGYSKEEAVKKMKEHDEQVKAQLNRIANAQKLATATNMTNTNLRLRQNQNVQPATPHAEKLSEKEKSTKVTTKMSTTSGGSRLGMGQTT